MPLYEYQCPQCGRFELIQKFSDPPLTSCPTCSSEVQKLLSAPAIQFKGSGWYITDYARKSTGGGAKGESAAGDGGGKSDTAKSGDSSTTGSATSSAGGDSSSSSSGSSTSTK